MTHAGQEFILEAGGPGQFGIGRTQFRCSFCDPPGQRGPFFFQGRFHPLALCYVEHDALKEERGTIVVLHHHCLIVEPQYLVVAGEQAIFCDERLAAVVAAGQFGQHARAVVRVKLSEPEIRAGHPLGLGEAQYPLDLRVHVESGAGFSKPSGIDHRRDLLDKSAVLGFRLAQRPLRSLVLGDLLLQLDGSFLNPFFQFVMSSLQCLLRLLSFGDVT